MAAISIQCKVTRFQMITPTVFEIFFTSEPAFDFQAGQFISVIVPGAGPKGRDLRRAYSFASSPNQNEVILSVKLVPGGAGSGYLYKLRPGDSFKAYAPYGNFIPKPNPDKDLWFISTGTGIAPFRSLVTSPQFCQELGAQKVVCMLGVREESELLYMNDFGGHPNVNWVPMVSRPQSSDAHQIWKKGRVTDYLRSLAHSVDWQRGEYYLCGNESMIKEVKSILAEKGVLKERIHEEVYFKDRE